MDQMLGLRRAAEQVRQTQSCSLVRLDIVRAVGFPCGRDDEVCRLEGGLRQAMERAPFLVPGCAKDHSPLSDPLEALVCRLKPLARMAA